MFSYQVAIIYLLESIYLQENLPRLQPESLTVTPLLKQFAKHVNAASLNKMLSQRAFLQILGNLSLQQKCVSEWQHYCKDNKTVSRRGKLV